MIAGYVYFDSDKFVRMGFQAESNLILALGPIHTAGKMALRVRNRHKDKLPAIAELKQTGQIDRILNKYSDFSL